VAAEGRLEEESMLVAVTVVAVLVLLGGLAVVGFNRLRRQDVAVDEAEGGIDVQLTRRADLVPNLVSTVKGYAAHEKSVLEEVTAARSAVQQAASSGSVPEKAAAEARLDRAVVSVMAVAEAYPDHKASANFLQLQEQLADTEGQLAFARQFYNDAAAQLNTSVSTIPWMFLAGMAGVGKREFYAAPVGQETPPAVQF
jgi:LemA protein